MYLIDTNICIYIMNSHPPEVIQHFRNSGVGNIFLSSITVSELQYGVCKSKQQNKNQKRLNEFLVPFEILPYDDNAAYHYGHIRANLEKRGCLIGPLDMLIAAHALSKNLILITNNEKEFTKVEALRLENWAQKS